MDVTDARMAVAPEVGLHVRQWPGATPPAFLLVHGLSSNARLWDEVAARLAAAGHAAYAVDLRSHGESDQPPEGYDTATAAADLAALAEALGLEKVAVAGQSWGGNVAVRLAAERPELVAALALIDGGWIDLAADFVSWRACASALRPPDIDGTPASRVRGWMWRAHPDWSPAAIEATVANLRINADGTVSRRLPIPQHMQIVRSMWEDPPQRYLPSITVPTLLMPAIPRDDPERAERTRSRVAAAAAVLTAATIREYADGDHDLHAQHPDRVAADLLGLVEAR
jgi:pimeloyl-ACP methyl ester carboxylesterase